MCVIICFKGALKIFNNILKIIYIYWCVELKRKQDQCIYLPKTFALG